MLEHAPEFRAWFNTRKTLSKTPTRGKQIECGLAAHFIVYRLSCAYEALTALAFEQIAAAGVFVSYEWEANPP